MRYNHHEALRPIAEADPSSPFVVGQLGQSLDGRIATPTGQSKYISGEAALIHLHRLRAAVDAVVVGVNTVIADDPQLTVRLAPGRSPARVVIDPNGRMPHDLRCLSDATATERLLAVRSAAHRDAGALADRIDVVTVEPGPDGSLPPAEIVAALHARGFRRILIEGGSTTLSRALAAGVVDALHVMVAPIILGSGTPGLALPPIDKLDEGIHPACRAFAFDDGDVLFACDLRRARGVRGATDAANDADATAEDAAAIAAE